MLYVPSHTRSTPYFVGIFAAYVYRYLKLDKPKFRFPYSKTLMTILITLYPLFLMTIQVFYVHEYNLWLSVIYTFMYRMVFATIVSIFIIISAINGFFKGKISFEKFSFKSFNLIYFNYVLDILTNKKHVDVVNLT